MSKEFYKWLGKRLEELRDNHGFSREDLGGEIGVTKNTVQNWEIGRSKISAQHLLELSNLYDISMDDIINEKVIEKKRYESFKELLDIFDQKDIYERYYNLNETHQDHVDSIISDLKIIENKREEADQIYLAAASGSEGLTREDLEDDIQMVLNLKKHD